MRISAQLASWLSLVFAIACITYGIVGFTSTEPWMSETQREDSRGFALFWMFLGAIGVASAIVSWLIAQGRFGASDHEGADKDIEPQPIRQQDAASSDANTRVTDRTRDG